MEKYFDGFNNIFHGIIAGPLLIFVFLYLQLDSGRLSPPLNFENFIFPSIVIFVVSIGYITWVFRHFQQRRKELLGKYSLKERLEKYRSISTSFYLLMTLSGIFAIILVFLTGELLLSLIYLAQLFLLSVYRPSLQNICKYLELKGNEREFVLKKREFDSNSN